MRGTKADPSSLVETDTAEMVHREHHQRFHNHQYLHQDRLLKRQSGGTPTDTHASPVYTVTEVTQTVSVIQQVVVDGSGSTIEIDTIQETSPPIPLTDVVATEYASTGPPAAPTTTPALSVSLTLTANSTLSSTSASGLSSTLTSAPALSSSTFASLVSSSSNSTTPSEPASLLSSTNHPSDATPAISIGSTTIASSYQSSSLTQYLGPTPSVLTSAAVASPTTENGGGSTVSSGIVGASSSSAAASTTAAVGSEPGAITNNNPAPPTSTIAGGVVGGIAGVALIIFLLMFILRYKQRSHAHIPIGSAPPNSNAEASRDATGPKGPSSSPGIMGMSMTERSLPFAIPAALASLTGFQKRARDPHHSMAASSTAGSEKGFYRVSGRKLQNVLQSGGDGYGDTDSISGLPAARFNQEHLSDTSFYRDSRGFYGGSGAPSPLNLGSRPTTNRESGVIVNRPSPARTPVISESPFADRHEIPGTPPFIQAESVGRSHPSPDMSHGSKFTEEV